MVLELIPIGTLLTVLTSQVIKTAQAAKDVVFEKESFKVLSKHLFDIERVLTELQLQKLNDSEAARQALEFLEADVKKANNLVDKYKNRARFYLLVKCSHIVKEVQDVTRDIGKSLAALSLANTEVLSGISEQVNRLQNEMQRAEFEASQSQLQIVDKLNQGLTEQKLDQGFANDMLKEIAKAVGVPVEPSEISKELESFRREKEEASNRKERAEVFFLEQIIELLSRADAARDYEQIKRQYFQRLQVIDKYDPREEYIQPFNAFICCITRTVMVDPVSLCTGTSCERTALEAWFACGEKTDPETGDPLEDFSYRSNLQLRQSIQEWNELNYCVKIRSCKLKLLLEGLLPYALGKSVTQITLVQLKERTTQEVGVPSSSYSASSGVRYVAAKFLGSGNGSRGLNGTSKANGGASRNGSMGGLNGSNSMLNSNFDGKGTYLLFNVGDSLYVGDLNSQDKDPIKAIHFSNSNPVCHAFDSEAKDGHDLLIGLNSGDVYSVSLRQQLQDAGKKLVGAQHYNKEASTNNSRCTSVAWIPGRDGAFVVAHADGNLYVYEKSKDGTGDASFPIIKDQTQFSVAHAKSSKSNPIMRWHICQGSIHSIAFSTDGKYLATVGRDGYLRVFDFSNEQLICGGKSYYGAPLCCAWSGDGKYILTGGEDDLVQVWSMEDRKVVAWGEGHNSWVSGVAFDSYWSPPNSEDTGENVMYRFGSVGQDTQLLLWDLSMDEIVVPLRRCPPGGSPTFSSGSPSSHWDSIVPVGTLQPAPSMRDVPKLSPLVAHRVHSEPQSGLIFTQESVLTACREGHVKIWMRPGLLEQQSSNSKATSSSSSKGKTTSSSKIGSSSYK